MDAVLCPHMKARLVTSPSLVKNKRPAAGPSHKGGITGWAQVLRDVRLLPKDTSLGVLTTLFDYYAFPVDCPA